MKKILLLEDNPLDVDLVGREIKRKWPNVELIVKSHLVDAKTLLANVKDIDCAIFDLKLPDGNGMELLKEIRGNNINLPVIILTGDGSEEIATSALKVGANDYITKKSGYHKIIPEQIQFVVNQEIINKQDLSVLYVEHHKSDIYLTELQLKKHAPFIHLTIVNTAEEALKLLPKKDTGKCIFDVLLIDYRLPGLNALELSKIIRPERKLSIAIVIVTGHGAEDIAVEALKIGIDDYIVKHDNYLNRLPSVLTSASRRKELERQQKILKQSETKFRLLADYAADWEYWINPEGEYIYISPICEKTSGYAPIEFEKNKNLLSEIALSEYRKTISEHFKEKITELHGPLEFKILTKDGKEKWINHICQPVFDDDNNYVGKRGVNRDITEQKNINIELAQSEERFKRMFEDLGDAVYVTRTEKNRMGEILEVNAAAVKQSGYSKEELLKMNIIQDLSIRDSRNEICLEDSNNQLLKGETVSYTEKKRKKNGEEYWTEIMITPIEYKGEKAGLSINRDITERKQAEEVMHKMSMALNNAGDIIFMTNTDGIISFVNPEFTKMYGYTAEEVVGKVTPRILKGNNLTNEYYTEFWNKLLNKQSIAGEYYVNKSKTGKLIDLEASADPIIDDNGDIIGFLAIQRDISERKRSEKIQSVILNISNATQEANDLQETMKIIQKELGRLMDTDNFFVALYDHETDNIHLPYYQDEKDDIVNFPAGKTLTGMVIKQGKSLLIDHKKAIKLEKENKIEKVGFDSEIWLGVPLKIKGKVTGAFVVQSYTNPNAYNEKDKEILEIISHQISISIERKREEEKLLAALEAAKESDRIKTAFLANMSHEFRTPLNAVIGFSDLLDENTTPADITSYAQLINKSGLNLLEIVDEIFEITLIEQNEVSITRSKMQLSTFLNDVYQSVLRRQKNLGNTNILIKKEIERIDEYADCYTDFQKLKHIFLNILGNALKFTPEGFVNFGVFLSDDGANYVFFVKDTGIGIPKEMHETIFEKFRIADESLTRKYGGIGAGLFICKRLITLLNGKIWIESQENKGSTFYFSIPK